MVSTTVAGTTFRPNRSYTNPRDVTWAAGVGWRLQQPPDAAGEVAFEAAQRFASAFAFGLLACEVGGGVGVQAAFGDGEAVQGTVELAVATAVEAVADGVSGRCGSMPSRRAARAWRRLRRSEEHTSELQSHA